MRYPSALRAVALAAAFAALPASAQMAPRSVRVSYNGFMNGLPIGTIQEAFESDAGNYRIVSDTKPMGLAALIQRQPLRFTSAGRVARDGLHPSRFEARRTANDNPAVSAEFDWPGRRLTLRHNGKTESIPLPAGTQDRLSVMYQFMFIPPERLRQLEFPMTNGRKLEHYRYNEADDPEIETGLGRLKTIHLVKQREPGSPVTEVWLSPRHRNLPVKLLIVERDGMRFEQVAQSLEIHE
jgi:hypothetical protein